MDQAPHLSSTDAQWSATATSLKRPASRESDRAPPPLPILSSSASSDRSLTFPDATPSPTKDEKGQDEGSGTLDSPFVVRWSDGDPEAPLNWPNYKKWTIVAIVATGGLCDETLLLPSEVDEADPRAQARRSRAAFTPEASHRCGRTLAPAQP